MKPILAKACCEMSRRDGAIVAWHEVPGTAPPQKSRPVGYGVIRAGLRTDSMIGVTKFRLRSVLSYGTLADISQQHLAKLARHQMTGTTGFQRFFRRIESSLKGNPHPHRGAPTDLTCDLQPKRTTEQSLQPST